MKNILIGLLIGLLLSGIVCYAKENIVINPVIEIISRGGYLGLNTTKITTPEGTYRVFIYRDAAGVGLSAIKIK